ncbi:Single hybrid motif [Sesbania bispinosa]|nr:Single hybrid motif [Sesbania bispinosa]
MQDAVILLIIPFIYASVNSWLCDLSLSLCQYKDQPVVKDLKYADSHEWVKVDGNSATVGITDHAQDHLGDVVYVELPEVGAAVTQGGSFGAVESVKATSDINSPVSGKVVEVNEELNSSPALVNSSPYGDGWIIKVEISNNGELNNLMDSEQYTKFCEEEDSKH